MCFDWIKVQFTAVKVLLLTHSWNCLTKGWKHLHGIDKLIWYIVISRPWRKHHNEKVPWNIGYWQNIWRMKYTVRTLICFPRLFPSRIFYHFVWVCGQKVSNLFYFPTVWLIFYQLVLSFLISSTKHKFSNLIVIQSYKSYQLYTPDDNMERSHIPVRKNGHFYLWRNSDQLLCILHI